jgi:SOUL heme-binding protein
MNPLSPAIIQVNTTNVDNKNMVVKTMTWPIQYALPGETITTLPKLPSDAPCDVVSIIIVPERVVAIRTFNDMIVEPLVRKMDRSLRDCLQRDGLLLSLSDPGEDDIDDDATNDKISQTTTTLLTFAQYDATYSMGERRSEVHIDLQDGTHPW